MNGLPPLSRAQAEHDLDNLRLASVPGRVVEAGYELEALMLTGACVDVTRGAGRAVRAPGFCRIRILGCGVNCVGAGADRRAGGRAAPSGGTRGGRAAR